MCISFGSKKKCSVMRLARGIRQVLRDLTAHGVTFLWLLRFSLKKKERKQNKRNSTFAKSNCTRLVQGIFPIGGGGALVQQCGLQSHSNSPLPRWLWNRNSSPNNYCGEYSGLGKSGLWRKWKNPWIRWTDAEESKRTKLKRVEFEKYVWPFRWKVDENSYLLLWEVNI